MEGFVPAFRAQTTQRLKALEERLQAGGCETYAEYRELCGEIRGLQTSIQYLSEAVKKFMEEEDVE